MRIISGVFGGRQLIMDGRLPIRPTSDKARGAVFSSVAALIPDAAVLDIFAGTGAVGLEALSRGAASVTAIEQSPKVGALINKNKEALGVTNEQYRLIIGGFERELPKLYGSKFTVIFADPPYSKGYAEKVLRLVETYELLDPQGVLIIEHFGKELITETSSSIKLTKTKNYGQTQMSYFAIGG